MEQLITNEQEQQNLKSYESENAFNNFHLIGLRDLEATLIHRYFLSGSKVLDIGSGYGRTTKPLADLGYDVIGIDVVPRMIQTARHEFPGIDFRLMSATDMQFADATFDNALFSFNGIDYIYPEKRRRQALREIHRVLKPGGICILTSHNYATIFTRLRKHVPRLLWRTLREGLLGGPYVDAIVQGGNQVTFCRMPWRQTRDFRRTGFEVIEVIGKRHTNLLAINLFESWPYYALRKV